MGSGANHGGGDQKEADRARLAAMQQWQERSGAYMQLQGTRPQTAGPRPPGSRSLPPT
jgi:hypothetical protein